MEGSAWARVLVPAWCLLLAVVVLGPALTPGYVLTYDMVWVPDLALRPDFLGVGSGLPRAVPSDAVVSVLDEVVPGMLLQKLLLVAALAGGGVGAAGLLEDRPVVVRLVAATCFVWNPLVAERLLIGHWPVLLGYAAMPWVIDASREWRRTVHVPARLLWLVPLGCLSASAGLATALVVVLFALGRRRVLGPLLLVTAANAPWLVSGLLHASVATTDPVGAEVFALHGEGSVPAPVAALGLGGIWNVEVVPASHTGVLGWVWVGLVIGLAATGVRSWRRRTTRRGRAAYLACWVVGFGLALLTWAAPGAVGWVVAHVPGAGVVRDGARVLVLCAPLLVVLVAEGAAVLWARRPPVRPAAGALAVALVLAPVAVLPDAAWGLASRLRPADYPAAYAEARRVVADATRDGSDVLLLPFSSYRQPAWNHDRKVLDPLGRYLTPDYVASDVLVISGDRLASEDPRVPQVAAALDEPSPQARAQALGDMGIGVVCVDREAPGEAPPVAGDVILDAPELAVISVPDATVREVPSTWRVAMGVAWAGYAVVLAGAPLAWLRRRRRDRRTAP